MGRKLDKIIVVDLEATCWRGQPPIGQKNEIIEIGLAIVETASLNIIDNRSIMVKPVMSEISEFCTELTSITPEMVEDGVSLELACHKISSLYQSSSRIWTSYGEYDKKQFHESCDFFNVKYPFSDMHWNIKSMASIFYGWPEMGMDKLLNRLNIEMDGQHHRGVDDAYNIAKILIEILKKGRE